MNRQEKTQLVLLALMVIFIFLLASAIFTLTKNIEYLKEEPIQLGVEQYNFQYCSCMTQDNVLYNFPGQLSEDNFLYNITGENLKGGPIRNYRISQE